MPGMFLRRPFFVFARLPNQEVTSRATNYFLQPSGRAAQACAQIRILLDGKCELKLPLKHVPRQKPEKVARRSGIFEWLVMPSIAVSYSS